MTKKFTCYKRNDGVTRRVAKKEFDLGRYLVKAPDDTTRNSIKRVYVVPENVLNSMADNYQHYHDIYQIQVNKIKKLEREVMAKERQISSLSKLVNRLSIETADDQSIFSPDNRVDSVDGLGSKLLAEFQIVR